MDNKVSEEVATTTETVVAETPVSAVDPAPAPAPAPAPVLVNIPAVPAHLQDPVVQTDPRPIGQVLADIATARAGRAAIAEQVKNLQDAHDNNKSWIEKLLAEAKAGIDAEQHDLETLATDIGDEAKSIFSWLKNVL